MGNEAINREINQFSEIVNTKKQLVLKIDQEMDYVYPDELYEYTIYCHNVSLTKIKDVHIKVIYPENILLEEDYDEQGISIGDIPQQQSHLLRIKARCSKPGIYTIHFICYGKETGLFTKQLTIHCDYTYHNPETTHRIHIYNFTPYEEKYILQSEDYSEDVTRLRKIQKLPYKAKQNPFSFIKTDLNNNFIIDESQNYIDQKKVLYDDPVNTDEHNYQYIGRENFNKSSIEYFEGRNLIDVLNQINDNSKLFKAVFLKTGTNNLLNDFKPYSPNGFIYRFGLMSSELFHYLGVLPEYSYMNDILFRWAPDGTEPLNLYPKKVAMHWDTKKWAGHGYQVYKTYTDEYKNEIMYNDDFKPLFEYIQHFDSLNTAQEYINKEYEYDTTNIYYIHTDEGNQAIRKYQYIIKESFFDTGVFYVHIPLDKIPTNFQIPSTEEIEAIVQKTKPYGMKPLIRYIDNVRFKHNMSFNAYMQAKINTKLHLGTYDRLRYTIGTYKYNDIIENICYINDNNEEEILQRESTRLIPDGQLVTNQIHFKQNPKINMRKNEPKNSHNMKMDLSFNTEPKECLIDNRLSYLSDLTELLYQHNFNNLSFKFNGFPLHLSPESEESKKNKLSSVDITPPSIDSINYKLWTQSLSDEKHSRHWTKETISGNNIDFIKISLLNQQLRQPNVEIGIGFEDSTGKKHGISSEHNNKTDLFDIKYTTSLYDVFKIHKNIISDISGLAFSIIQKESKTIVLFFIEKQENNKFVYHYFHHIVISGIQEVFCFIRNEKDISGIHDLANIISMGKSINTKIFFNTPQFYEKTEYDPSYIITEEKNPWKNLSRVDKNEHSYAIKHNISSNIESVDDIILHFDNIVIPDDSIVKDINTNIIIETNANKPIYYSIRKQDGFITPNSDVNQISLYPNNIEVYPANNQNIQYYQEQYNIALDKNIKNSINFFNNKIKENDTFDTRYNPSLNLFNDIDNYITIQKSFWSEISGFTTESFSFNDIEECQFIVEGYNHGGEANLISQLKSNNQAAQETVTTIPSGYFIKYISLKFLKEFITDKVSIKFKFNEINNNIDIFDMHTNITFKTKQNIDIPFEEYNTINIAGKKLIKLSLLDNDNIGYIFNNGISIKLAFDDLEIGEYYKIYSIVTNIVYQNQSVDFLANKDNFRNIQYDNDFIIVSGQANNAYLSGMFFDDKPSVFQYDSAKNINNKGIELSDTLYQSFVAQDDNITSITLYPDGFVGNPDLNLKIGLYTNKGFTPNTLIKEINVLGWSKANDKLKNKESITYNFNVNNLKIGATYWLKIKIEEPKNDSYYLLKYLDSSQSDFKLLSNINNNLINNLGVLKFQINSIDLYKSFNSIPSSQDILNNPNIFIGLNRGRGSITNLKIRKV